MGDFVAAHDGWGHWAAYRCSRCGDIRVTNRYYRFEYKRFETRLDTFSDGIQWLSDRYVISRL